jgi:hypothetical protein
VAGKRTPKAPASEGGRYKNRPKNRSEDHGVEIGRATFLVLMIEFHGALRNLL